MTPKTQLTKGKTNKLDFIKIQNKTKQNKTNKKVLEINLIYKKFNRMVEYKAEKICWNVEGKDKDMKKKRTKTKN